jgi:hypothetical protein
VRNRAKGLVADRRLFLALDQTRVVEDGSPEAAFLLAPQGDVIPTNEAARLGLELVDGCIVQRQAVEPQVACPKCRFFVMAVQGVRGPYWEGREQAGRRRSYRVGGDRDGSVTVGRDFFADFCRQCAWWLDHVADENDPGGHVTELPAWVVQCWARVRRVERGHDAAARVAAEVLGISVRSVYRGMGARQ